jgi:flagellar basal-body rod modification protein FlgD
MAIDSITGVSSATTPSSTGALKGTKDEFLKLFMAQLEHQDPLDPKNGSDMVAQLAQFSSVEQQTQTNQQLASLTAAQTSAANAGLSSLVGRTCDATAGTFQIEGGKPPALDLTATGPIKGAQVVITNAEGKEIRRIAVPDGAPPISIQWDGKDAGGLTAPPGSYKIDLKTTGATTVTAQWHGRVDALELTADGPRLRMGGLLLSPGDIRTIGATTSSTSPTGALS